MEPILQELQAAATAAADPQQHAAALSAADKAPQLSREEIRVMRQQADPNFAKRKQRQQAGEPAAAAEGGGGGGGGEMLPPPAKKPRTAAAAAAEGNAAAAAAAAPEQGQQPEGQPAAAAAAGAASEQPQTGQQAQQEQQQQRAPQANTAFVKHLWEGADEGAVRKLFAGCGEISSLNMGIDRETGRLKVGAGSCWVCAAMCGAACERAGWTQGGSSPVAGSPDALPASCSFTPRQPSCACRALRL